MHKAQGWDDSLAMHRKYASETRADACKGGIDFFISRGPIASPDPKNFITGKNDSEILYPCYRLAVTSQNNFDVCAINMYVSHGGTRYLLGLRVG